MYSPLAHLSFWYTTLGAPPGRGPAAYPFAPSGTDETDARSMALQLREIPASPHPAPAGRPAPEDVLERAPRLVGREIDLPAAPPRIVVPPPPPSPPPPELPSGPRTDVLPRLASGFARLTPSDADLDRQQLFAALGAVASPLTAAPAAEWVASAPQALVAVKRVLWSETARALVKDKLAAIADKAGSNRSAGDDGEGSACGGRHAGGADGRGFPDGGRLPGEGGLQGRGGAGSVEARAGGRELARADGWRAALALEIRDVRRIAGTKYNQAIQKMLRYARTLQLLTKR